MASEVGVSLAEVVTRVGARVGQPDLVHLGALDARPNDPAYLVAEVRRLRDTIVWWATHPA